MQICSRSHWSTAGLRAKDRVEEVGRKQTKTLLVLGFERELMMMRKENWISADTLTFLTEHAVPEQHLCKEGVLLEGPGQHTASICRQALATQVQSRDLTSPAFLELSHNTLLRLHTSVLTQTQVRMLEILHYWLPVSPFRVKRCPHVFLISTVTPFPGSEKTEFIDKRLND